METVINSFPAFGGKVTIKVEDTTDKPAPWGLCVKENTNHHEISVTTKHGSHTFDFWNSISDGYIWQQPSKSRGVLLGALGCLLRDALCGAESFDDFCSGTGYDQDSRKAFETWKECKKSFQAISNMLQEGDIYDANNWFQENFEDYA